MKLDFEKALKYMSSDSQWVGKLIISSFLLMGSMAVFVIPLVVMILSGSALGTITSFVVCFVISFIIIMALAGYFCVTSNERIKDESAVLPDWNDFGRFITVGLKYFAGYFIYVLPLCLLVLLFIFLFIFASGAPHFSGLASAVSFIVLTLIGAAALFVYILTMAFLPLMIANFNKNLKVLSFVEFKDAFEMLKDNIGNYVVLILLFIALGILGQIACSLLCVTIMGIIFIPFIYSYIYLVLAEIIAQFVNSKS